MCVDDEKLVLEGLERTLFEKFEVIGFDKPAEALAVLERTGESFAAVISDMRMPEMDGAQFLARARAVAPDTTRILLTGQVDLNAAIAAVNHGSIFRFLCKPCAADVLIPALEAAVDQHRLIRAERELLEKTLTSCIRMLTEVLSLLAPGLFARSERIRAYVVHAAARLKLENAWRFELAGALSMLGCVGLPQQTLEQLLAGKTLDASQKKTFEEHPGTAYRLLSGIPRLGEVAEMVRGQLKGADRGEAFDDVQKGASLLRIALELDHMVESGVSLPVALGKLEQQANMRDRPLVAALSDFRVVDAASEVRELKVSQMTAHMVLDEDVRTNAGVVVVPKGRELSMVLLERLWKFSNSKSLIEPIRVRVLKPP